MKRSELAGWAGYGYCASHSRFFWGLRLHLVCTPAGLPVAFALATPKTDEREVARDLLEIEPELLARRGGQTVIADKGYASREFETFLHQHGAQLLRPAYKNEPPGAQAPDSSNRSVRSSSRSTTPSRANSTSNDTADEPPTA